METKEYEASDEMKLFFNNLLSLKKFVKKNLEKTDDPTLREIYNKLDHAIKETKP